MVRDGGSGGSQAETEATPRRARRWPLLLLPLYLVPFLAALVYLDLIPFGLRETASPWTEAEHRQLRALSLASLEPPPADPSNRVAEDPRAVALGRKFFFDPRFSADGSVACATCHKPEKYFTDGLPRSRGLGETRRGAPSLIGAAYSPWLYWDGRRDSLWSQALVPVEAPEEHGFSRRKVLQVIAADPAYRAAYGEIFGPLPAPDGEAAEIDRAFANFGKVLAAFEGSLLPRPAPFDRYVAALDEDPRAAESLLSAEQIAGLKLFIGEAAQCTRCHNGPLLTNFGFHNIGLIKPRRGVTDYDFGRRMVIEEVRSDPFRCDGPHSDAGPEDCQEEIFIRTVGRELISAFKVPTLRNVAQTAPYMHDGRFATLREVLEHYRAPPLRVSGHQELEPLTLTDAQLDQIAAFLGSLTGPIPSFDD